MPAISRRFDVCSLAGCVGSDAVLFTFFEHHIKVANVSEAVPKDNEDLLKWC